MSRRHEDDIAEAKARVGQKLLGKWTLRRLIGVGGMAAVYEAEHKLGHHVAIKMLHPDVAVDAEMKSRFEQEAFAVSKIDHPGVVSVTDVEADGDGVPFIVMELLEGKSLAERLAADGKLEADEAIRIGVALCEVLEAAHARGIIHRDVKPANLFLEPSGRLRVLDFGIARWRQGPGALVTAAGTMLGTAAYMAPEQVKGVDIDPRVDVFAAGATLFRALTGHGIHELASTGAAAVENAERELVTAMLTRAAPRLASVASDLPEGLCQVVDRALAFHRGRRYLDAAALRADLEAVQRGEAPPFATARLAAGDEPDDLEEPPEAAADATAPGPAEDDAAAAEDAAPAEAKEDEGDVAIASDGTVKMAPGESDDTLKSKVASKRDADAPTSGSEKTTVRERRSASDAPTRARPAKGGLAGVSKTLPVEDADESDEDGDDEATSGDGPRRFVVAARAGGRERGTGVGRLALYILAFIAVCVAIWWFSNPPKGDPSATSASVTRSRPATTAAPTVSETAFDTASTSTSGEEPAASTSADSSASASSSASESASAVSSAPAATTAPKPPTTIVIPSSFPPLPSGFPTALPTAFPSTFPFPTGPKPTATPSATTPPATTAPPAPRPT